MGHSVNHFIESIRTLLSQIINLGNQFADQAKSLEKLSKRNKKVTDGALQESADHAFTIMQQGKTRAETAVEHSNAARNTLGNINNAIALMADMNTQIAAAAEEQSMVSSEISENANKLSMFSREAAELSEGVSDSTKSLSSMAAQLKNQLLKFKL